MLPIVTLIGRPNVGKSTLFNCFTRTHDALVANSSMLTRDRRYGYARIKHCEFICIDTGGIDHVKNDLAMCVARQSFLAIEEADVILFIVDASTGLVTYDVTIAKYLHSKKKPIFLVANKIDGIDFNKVKNDFWLLGISNIYPVAASHGRGVNSLLKAMLKLFIDKIVLQSDINKEIEYWNKFKAKKTSKVNLIDHLKLDNFPIKLAIVGRPNVGKSTLANCILGKERMVVSEISGTTRDSIYIPTQFNNNHYILIDTAGIRKRSKITEVIEKFSIIKTFKAISDANVVILVIDAHKGVYEQDLSLINFVLNSGRSLVIVVNKWDNLHQAMKDRVRENLNNRLKFINLTHIHFISALNGRGIDNLFKSIYKTYISTTKHITTTMLMRVMIMATRDHQPPLIHGRRIKMKYVHIGGYNPLIIVVHGNKVKDLPDSYKRYLEKYFQKSLEIIGTSIHFHFKENNNPFFK